MFRIRRQERQRELKREAKHTVRTPTETAAETRTGLCQTYLIAAELVVFFILCTICYLRLMSSLDLVGWSQSRCELLNPGMLKTIQLKHLLTERGIDYDPQSGKQELEALVSNNGGVMEIDMETFSDEGDSSNYSQTGAKKFDHWNELEEGLPNQQDGVYLVLCSSELERRASELKRWRQFLHRLSKHGISFMFVRCSVGGHCDSPSVVLLTIWKSKTSKTWTSNFYTGPMRPTDILDWINKTLSERILRVDTVSTTVFNELRMNLYDKAPTVVLVAHSIRPHSLSFAVLAAEFRSRASFVLVKTLDQYYIPNRASLMVLSSDGNRFYHRQQFLNQAEIRWLLTLLAMDPGDLVEIVILFLGMVAMLTPFVAEGGVWQRVKAMLWFLLLWMIVFISVGFCEYFYNKDCHEAMQFLATSFVTLIKPFQPDLLLLFHLFSEYPLMNLIFPLYALMAAFKGRIREFFGNLFVSSNTSDSTKPTSLTPVSTATSSNVHLNVIETTAQIPSNVTMATSGADGPNSDCQSDDRSTPNTRVIAVTQSQSLEHQSNSSLNAGPIQHDPAALLSPSNGTMRSGSTTQPFEYPPLVDSANGELDKTTAEQITRLKIPKFWLQPIISDKELKLAVALQKSEARDQRSFEPASRTVPRCFYCGADFRPTSEVRVLPCLDIFHPGCMDAWMKEGNIDCPLCQIPLYATDRRNLAED